MAANVVKGYDTAIAELILGKISLAAGGFRTTDISCSAMWSILKRSCCSYLGLLFGMAVDRLSTDKLRLGMVDMPGSVFKFGKGFVIDVIKLATDGRFVVVGGLKEAKGQD